MNEMAQRYFVEYYQDNIQDTKIKKDKQIINFPPEAINNLLKDMDNTQFIILGLVQDIKKAKRISNIENNNCERPDIDHFQVYKGFLGEHWIAVSKDGSKLNYYNTVNIPDDIYTNKSVHEQVCEDFLSGEKPMKDYGDFLVRAMQYYREYISGLKIKKDKQIIYFLPEAARNLFDYNDKFPYILENLVNDLKKAKRISDIENNKEIDKYVVPEIDNIKPRDHIDHFQVYQGKLGEHWIAVLKDDGELNYFATVNTPQSICNRKEKWYDKILYRLATDIWLGHSIDDLMRIVLIVLLVIIFACAAYAYYMA